MEPRLMKYNPAFLSEEELIHSFVARQTDLADILETIRENQSNSNAHILIIGPRGSGKTMLVLRIAAAIRSDENLNRLWYPLILGEESYEVASAGEFWLSALFKLGKQGPQGPWSAIHDELLKELDDERLGGLALARLMEFSKDVNKRILLIVENMNMILGDQLNDDDAWSLRHTLQNEPRLMLLGSATSRFDEIECQGKAMYELFRLHELEPLDEEECNRVWQLITQREVKGREVRPIQILTGGNIRLLAILCSFVRKSSLNCLLEELAELIDDHTDYFKSNIEALSHQERKVFVTLAGLWDPSTALEVSKSARLNVNLISSVLNRLEGRGAVQVIDKIGRKKVYQVTERLYNIFYLMRRHGGRTGRVRAAIRFMIALYSEEELVDAAVQFAREACKLNSDARKDYLSAYEAIVTEQASEDVKRRIIKATNQEYFTLTDVSSSIVDLGNKFNNQQDSEKNEEILRLMLKQQPGNSQILAGLGKLLEETSERFDEAEAAYRQAVEIQPDYAWAWTLLGYLLEDRFERYEEAEVAYRQAVEIQPDYAWAWARLGYLLEEKLKRFDEAETAYRQAVEVQPDYAYVWLLLGKLLEDRFERYDEAEVAYRQAVEVQPDYAWAWTLLGRLLEEKLKRFDEAEKAYRQATEVQPDFAWAWTRLGSLMENRFDQIDDAETMYRKVIEIEQDNAYAWLLLGRLLEDKFERYEESEAAYRQAVEVQPANSYVARRLLVLQLNQEADTSKILKTASLFIEASKHSPESLNLVAKVFYMKGNNKWLSHAKSLALEALENEPDNWLFAHTLVSILGAEEEWIEALEVAKHCLKNQKVIEDILNETIEFFVAAAAAGHTVKVLHILEGTIAAEVLEPLVVGLRLLLGEKVQVAKEILEVGKDVEKRIRSRISMEEGD